MGSFDLNAPFSEGGLFSADDGKSWDGGLSKGLKGAFDVTAPPGAQEDNDALNGLGVYGGTPTGQPSPGPSSWSAPSYLGMGNNAVFNDPDMTVDKDGRP